MTCPQCQHKNENGAKFCEQCAAALVRICLDCGHQLSPMARFCPECARPTGLTLEACTAPRFTPAEKIFTSKAAREGERKQVTVLFADLKGSMELLADRDPEEARRILDPVLERMMEAVHRYEGTVNQVMGDGVMALFGAPLAYEDHAVRACYAALHMQAAISRLAEEVRTTCGTDVRIRIGINSGEVVVRAISSDFRMDYTAVGQTTHLAARMEQLARPGTILLTADTLRLAGGFIRVETIGPISVKGLDVPLEVYELIGTGPVRRRLEAAAARGLVPFVGRRAELAALEHALEQAEAGCGRLVALVGDPGVGKSRLISEFAHSPKTRRWLVLESGSVPYGKTATWMPIVDLLKKYFEIQVTDDDRMIREKVSSRLRALDQTLTPALPAFLTLLDVPNEDPHWEDLDPQQRRARTHEAVTHLLLRESHVQPLLFVVEDLHWIDSETQAVLDGLTESLPTARMLLLVSYRPEYQHEWASHTCYAGLRIDPLSIESAATLLQDLLGGGPELEQIKRLLIERTQGNPFFLEESVQTLIETRVLAGKRGAYRLAAALPTIQVPQTVQAILAARVDRLRPDEKSLLQIASVIGKDVPFDLLQAVADIPEDDLQHCLGRLKRTEFLHEAKLFPDLEYTFKHVLTHEVAYGGLLNERRKALHAKVVAAIERLYAGPLGEQADTIARHAIRGEVWDKAVDYLREAGLRAHAVGLFQDSLDRFERAFEILPRLSTHPDNTRRRIDARLDLHLPLFLLGQFPRLVRLHQEAEQLARRLGDQPRLGRVAYRMGIYSLMNAEFARSAEYCHLALDIATTTHDRELHILATFTLGAVRWSQAEYRAAIDLLLPMLNGPDASLAKRRLGTAWCSPYTGGCAWAAWSFASLGDFNSAISYADIGVQAAQVSDHAQAQVIVYTIRATVLILKGAFADALSWCERAIHLAETTMLPVWGAIAYSMWGWALAWSGRSAEGLCYLERGTAGWERVGVKDQLCGFYFRWAEGLFLAGHYVEAERIAAKALEAALAFRERGTEADALRLLGEIAAAGAPPDFDLAADFFARAEVLAGDLGMGPLLARCHLHLGRLARRTGDRARAAEYLMTASARFREMDMRFWLEKAKVALEEPA